MRQIIIIGHNLRSAHNVGSLIRTADGLGVKKVILSGYTPYPMIKNDERMPHLAAKLSKQIEKTALGAEKYINVIYAEDVFDALKDIKKDGYEVVALEQDKSAVPILEFIPSNKIAIILGSEVDGMDDEVLRECDRIVEIPMLGRKESFNVVQAAAIFTFYCRNYV